MTEVIINTKGFPLFTVDIISKEQVTKCSKSNCRGTLRGKYIYWDGTEDYGVVEYKYVGKTKSGAIFQWYSDN